MSTNRPVLVLEDDSAVAALIQQALAQDGWQVSVAGTLAAGRAQLERDNPRILVVDLGLPDGNGISFIREAAQRNDLGIIVVSGRSDEVDRVVGLEMGADDYVTKPFSPREMAARVRALDRRLDAKAPSEAPPRPPALAKLGDIVAEPSRHRIVAADGRHVRLTGAEARFLELLLSEPGHTAERGRISQEALGRTLLPEQRGPDQLACALRRKLEEASGGAVSIAVIRGKGYRLTF